MSFFDRPPPPPPMPEPQRERWSGASHDTIGVPVPLVVEIVRTEEVAVIVSGIVAYPTGFSLNLVTFTRRQSYGMPPMHLHMRPGMPYDEDDLLRFGIRFSDGSKVTNMSEFPGMHAPRGQPSTRMLMPSGGGGGGRKYTQGLWCQPLPPAGDMAVVIAWPKFEIDETEHVVDADAIIEAAAGARPIWPDDVDLPPTAPQWPSAPGPGSWGTAIAFGPREPEDDDTAT